MEVLFTTTLPAAASYQVSFHEDAYHFEPTDSAHTSFSLRRENDEWKGTEGLDESLFAEAVAALDDYLLSQH